MKDGDSRHPTEIAVFSLVEQGLQELGLSSDPVRIEQFSALVSLLAHWAQRINLTGHRDPLEMTTRLVMDAAALSAALPELASAKSLVDLGSGAGFPGLPIAILHPDLEVHLVEARLKRNHFQREACRRLGLSGVRPILGRSDQVEAIRCDVVVAQAMTQPERALELMLPWARNDGLIVLPASSSATQPQASKSIRDLEQREYVVPGSGKHRKLWIARPRPD